VSIEELVKAAEWYRSSEVLETAQSNGVLMYLVDRGGKPIQDVQPSEDARGCTCPLCNEAIIQAQLAEVGDWSITGNKFAGTDREVLAVSKEHTPHIGASDMRVWMHIARATGGLVLYSPAEKSIPSHKHAPLFAHDSPLQRAPAQSIGRDVGLIVQDRHRSLVIEGEFEARYERTVAVLRRLYAREHLYNLAITAEKTFIQPSQIIGKILGNRLFIGLASTEDRALFEYAQLPAAARDDERLASYRECDYSERQLEALIEEPPVYVPCMEDLREQLDGMQANKVGAVLSVSEEKVACAAYIANELGAEAGGAQFYFFTDKKGNFFADCKLPQFQNTAKEALLIVADTPTVDIARYLASLKDVYSASEVIVLWEHDDRHIRLDRVTDCTQADVPGDGPSCLLKKEVLEVGPAARSAIETQAKDIAAICREDNSYVEMVVGCNAAEAGALSFVASKFPAASVRALQLANKDWPAVNQTIKDAVVPYLRKWNPINQRPLAFFDDNHRDILRRRPEYEYEEGVIVVYLDREASGDMPDILSDITGRKVFAISSSNIGQIYHIP